MMYARKTIDGKLMPQPEEEVERFVPLRTRSELLEALRSGLSARQEQPAQDDILETVARLHDPEYQDSDTILTKRPDFTLGSDSDDDEESGMTSIITRKPFFRDEVAGATQGDISETVSRPRVVVNPYVQPAAKAGKGAPKKTAAAKVAKPAKTPRAAKPAKSTTTSAPKETGPSLPARLLESAKERLTVNRIGEVAVNAGTSTWQWSRKHPYLAGASAALIAATLVFPQVRGAIAGIGDGVKNECDNATWCSASAQPKVDSSIEFPDLADPKKRVSDVAAYLIDPRPESFKFQYDGANVKSIGIRVGLSVPDSAKLKTVGIVLSDQQQKSGKIDKYTNPDKLTPAQYAYFVSQYPEAFRGSLQDACYDDLNKIIKVTQDKAGTIIADKDAAKALKDGESSVDIAKGGKDNPKKANVYVYDVDPDATSGDATRVLSCQ